MRKIISSIAFSFFIFSFLSLPVLAQTPSSTPAITVQEAAPTAQPVNLETTDLPAEVEATKELNVEFKQFTQDPRSKKIRFEMILKPTITSERVEIQWSVRGVSTPTKDSKLKGFLKVTAGQTYRVPIEVVPTTQGATEVLGRAQVFGTNSNIVATVRKNFASNLNGEILPITSEYKSLKSQYQLIKYAMYGFGLLIVIVGGFFGLKAFIKWLDKDDIK